MFVPPPPDIKPSNILLDRNGNIKLCDFGISGQLVDSIAKTRDAGCRPYMAVSHRSGGHFSCWLCDADDMVVMVIVGLFSLGDAVFFMMTDWCGFHGNGVAVIVMVLTEQMLLLSWWWCGCDHCLLPVSKLSMLLWSQKDGGRGCEGGMNIDRGIIWHSI